ncbi:hypothetical protein NIES4106_07180 [Fischerella sp. NIES-4106]|nr:hypothetical protein NIES4106_07180 [Fischerella sp. NIES-4106]
MQKLKVQLPNTADALETEQQFLAYFRNQLGLEKSHHVLGMEVSKHQNNLTRGRTRFN